MEGLTRRILFWSLLLSLLLVLAFVLICWLDPLPSQQLYAIRVQAYQAGQALGRSEPPPQPEFGRANLPPYLGRGRGELLGWLTLLAGLGLLGCWRLARPLERALGQLAEDCRRLERGQPLQGEMSGIASNFASILAELERQQAELNQASQAARKALCLRERLLDRSHAEFRLPLVQMRESLTERPEHAYLVIIARNLDSLLRLVDDLAVGEPLLRPQQVQIRDFLERSLETFHDRVRLGEGPSSCLELDELRTGQVLLNLVSNALKYSQAEVEVNWGEDWIEVGDSGPGMAQADIPELMREFRQQEPGRQDGVGMGLATAQRWMELQGGWLEIQSSPGQGTRARLCFTKNRKKLPAAPADAEPA